MNDLEKTIEEKIKPLVSDAMQKYLGVTVKELEQDISKTLKHPIMDVPDVSIPFKKAKKLFKKNYLARLLHSRAGNVLETAKVANIDRRSIHRLIAELDIPISSLREPLSYVRQDVQHVITSAMQTYIPSLNPIKVKQFAKYTPTLSRNIARIMPEQPLTLTEAEREFEKEYLRKALGLFDHNISKTARAIGLRFETLHRKLKSLGVLSQISD
ncbi:MAG: helix-turn-helix domain-containing protein [Nanoarchaeota archaeon]